MKNIFLILSLILTTSLAEASGFSATYMIGELYQSSAVRVGYDRWEVGLLNRQSYGVIKTRKENNFYAGGGLALLSAIKPSVGLFGCIGYEPKLFSAVYFRAELTAAAGFTGQFYNEAILGLSLNF